MFNYSDFQAGLLRKFQFARPGCGRNEYRQGVLNAAQARLFEQDLNRDGVLTFDEYVRANEYVNQKRDAANCRTPIELSGNYHDYTRMQQQKLHMYAQDFKALDVNQDGVLDKRELANEISLMDKLGGRKDGIVSQRGHERLWNNSDPRVIGAMLRDNYLKTNAKNLGMPWDRFGNRYSRNVGEICNPYNLNNPLAVRGANPYGQQIISPIAPQAYNPIAQMYNPTGYIPMAQSIYPNMLNSIRQNAYMNGYLNIMQNTMNQMINMMRMLVAQNYAY